MRPPSASEVPNLSVEDLEKGSSGNSALAEPSPEGSVYVFPASLEQIRYWTLDQLDGASTASNMAIAARLEGTVNDEIVERSIQAIVERHEALRTTFRVVEGRLCQVISEEARYDFSVTDLRTLPTSERDEAAAAAIEAHSHARADLAAGPAFFVRLIHVTDELHFLALTMHHIVCDGWSNGILIRDFTDFYAAFSQNKQPDLTELPFQFADFTVWQQDWLESDAAQAALAYWRTQIDRGLPAVDLPTDQPRQPKKSYPGSIESTLLPAALTIRLKAYCRAHNATMHQVLLAAFEALIARYANQKEFLLGSTIANRTQPGMENVVGRFANPQVILADVNGDPTYAQLLRRVTEWSTESYAHQDLPFSRLMEEFQLDQAGATSQFLQVYFVYQKAFMQPQEAPGLKVIPRPSVSGGVNFDLLVSIVERAEGPRLQMEYNTVLFRKERILSLLDMYVRVLESVMEDDAVTVSHLPLVSSQNEHASQLEETIQVLAATSGTTDAPAQNLASGQSLPQWLDSRAAALGEAPAILSGTESLSWNALRERSQSIASLLLSKGVSAGDTVALRLESGFSDAAIAWALLRIGATVLPLPASASSAEWTAILATAHPKLALASSNFAANVAGITSYEKLFGADIIGAKSGERKSLLSNELAASYPDPSSAAWLSLNSKVDSQFNVIPSSHVATLQQLLAAADALDLRTGDVTLITSSESATDAWIDLLLPLVSGSTLLYSSSQMPEKLQPLLEQHQVSFVLTTPAGLLSAVHDRWGGDRRLNVVLRGGLLVAGQIQRLTATPLRLWSLVSSSVAAGPLAVARISNETLPAFVPLAGQRLTVLDDNGHAVPAGVSGELAIHTGSAATRTGYLARSIAATTSSVPSVNILDSVDRVIRLHGYRLRLGELEEILWQSPAVADVVSAVLPVDGSSTLVAWFQPFAPTENNTRAIQDHFRAVAPGHVAGAQLIAVDRIPRRSDGSADLSLLPAPGSVNRTETSTEEYVPPRDELESSLVAIWEDVLGVRPIGIRSPFFKLGGYSLMIVRLFARINKALGTALPITTIFNAPTVEQLADIVRGRAYYSALVPVQTKGTRPPFFMIHSYLLYQGIPAELGEDFPFYGLRELDTDAKDMTVEQRAASCVDMMRSVQPHGPYYIGAWCAAGPLGVEIARQIVVSGEKVGFLVLFDSWRPGYAAELSREQAGKPEMSLGARLHRKYRFHQNRWRTLSFAQRVRYIGMAIGHKTSSLRSKFYLKNWAIAEWFCNHFGLPLPHFMHNVSLTTLNSLKEYRLSEPYPGPLTLIRAQEAPYFPGSKDHCGWASIVQGEITVLWAPGDHESMFVSPNLQTVGEFLRQSLTEAYAQHQA